MSRIVLPYISWFLMKHEGRFVTNTHSGSLGTQPDSGCMNVRTFNYRVWVDTKSGKEGEVTLAVEAFITQPWCLGGHKTDVERVDFECSDDGVQRATQWLSEKNEGYGFSQA